MENPQPEINPRFDNEMNKIAESYVKLILKIGLHDPDYVDAYYGPAEWNSQPISQDKVNDSLQIQNLYNETDSLLNKLESMADMEVSEIETLRYRYIYKQLLAAKGRLVMLSGGSFSFNEEAKALYDADVPQYSEQQFKEIIDELNALLPGVDSLSTRLNNFRKDFIIPKEKLDTVFMAAIKECRKRTMMHIELPDSESFVIEYVTDKPWGGYNWYKGKYHSIIQINTDLPVFIDRAVDLAAHEGFPGHHVYNTLLEKKLVNELGWKEYTVYPLFSPQSLIAEGTANYGIEVAFPGNSRIEFEKNILFPLAGLDPSMADKYYQIMELAGKLDYAENEAARNYIDGNWDKDKTIKYLMDYRLMSYERAAKYLSFIERYRSYVINYNLGKDIVKNYIESNGGKADDPDKRWELFKQLISNPETPSGILKNTKNNEK